MRVVKPLSTNARGEGGGRENDPRRDGWIEGGRRRREVYRRNEKVQGRRGGW